MKRDWRPCALGQWALVLGALAFSAAGSDGDLSLEPPRPLSLAAVESLLTSAGWTYAAGESKELYLLFAGESQPDRQVVLIVEHTRDGHPWGVTFLHPVGTIDGPRASAGLEPLLRAANDFNATRMFGKVVLSPQEDGSWAIRYLHSFDFSSGISPASFLDPLMLLVGEMEGLYDRFFETAPSHLTP